MLLKDASQLTKLLSCAPKKTPSRLLSRIQTIEKKTSKITTPHLNMQSSSNKIE